MATGIGHLINTPQTAIGKGTVGEPPPAPAGKKGVIVRIAVFFDGTKNNRTNTAKRLNDPTGNVLQRKGEGSSYANFYSNPAIHEFMNKRNRPEEHEVSLYVEGIGTEDFSDQAEAAGMADKKNGRDTMRGNAFGAGPTGIREKVQKGINQLTEQVKELYDPIEEYIEKIVVDAFGFSRGAAAARHFIHRRSFLYGPYPKQERPELVVNFVGLYDTVSSFARQGHTVPRFLAHVARHGLNTDKVFCDDVQELGLDMGAVPGFVVHLAAADEHRQNFSLTNINSTLRAGKGVEVCLPGVHSDIGGSYAERDPANPTGDPAKPMRALNLEARRIASSSERAYLLDEGWYTAEQIQAQDPSWRARTANTYGLSAGPAMPQLTGVRYLTNEYQYLTLRIVHNFALGQHGATHEHKLELEDFGDDRFAAYRVPAELESLAQHLEGKAASMGRAPAERNDEAHPHGTPPTEIKCRSEEETRWLRNRYLHRSAKQPGDVEPMGMEARAKALRLIVPDDDLDYVPPSLRRPAPVTAALPVEAR